jgi:hypothetical protein
MPRLTIGFHDASEPAGFDEKGEMATAEVNGVRLYLRAQ